MSSRACRSIVSPIFLVCVLVLAGCTPPGPSPAAGGKPVVSIIAPVVGAQFASGETVTVQVMAMDTRGVSRVELLVDNALVATQSLPQPQTAYQGSLAWAASSTGAHTLLVQAVNTGGIVSDPAVLSVLVTDEAGPTQVVSQPPTPATPGVPPPTGSPTQSPTVTPTGTAVPPTVTPTKSPTKAPTKAPTAQPTKAPTNPPTPKTGFSNFRVKTLSDTRIRVTVDYVYDGAQGDTVLVVAEPTGGNAAGAAFLLTPSLIQKGQGTVKVETEYQGTGTVTSQGIDLILSDNMGQNFYRQSFAHQQTWKTSAPSTVVHDFVDDAFSAGWKNSPGQVFVPFGEAACGDAGCFFWRTAPATVMEDGSRPAQVLITRPQRVPNGGISGFYSQQFAIQAGDRLVGKVGFIAGAAAGDAQFLVHVFPQGKGGPSVQIVNIQDTSNGALKSFDVSLDPWAGQKVWFELSVLGGSSPDDDWATWVEAKLMR